MRIMLKRYLSTWCAVIVITASIAVEERGLPEPLRGQIVVDPHHPEWLRRHEGPPVFICGPGDPEGFLYRGTRLQDGTRKGDQLQIIRKMIQHGGNCLYMQIIRSHGGDGSPDHNPFVDSNPSQGLDEELLNQWEQWFNLMDQHGILIYLFFYDDSARIWNTGDNVGPDEKRFLQTIVQRFHHYKNLVWIVAEESEEAYSTERVQNIARTIREADPHDHIVGNHHHSGTTFKSWKQGGYLNHFAMQLEAEVKNVHSKAVEAFGSSKGRYQTIYSENTKGEPTALYAWRCAMGGLMPMLLEMDVANTPVEELKRCRILQHFFERTNFNTLIPHDELALGETKWLLANMGESYIAYSENLSQIMDIANIPPGNYHMEWVDCESGIMIREYQLIHSGHTGFKKPNLIGKWCALWATWQQ
jgi:hypothetical protein